MRPPLSSKPAVRCKPGWLAAGGLLFAALSSALFLSSCTAPPRLLTVLFEPDPRARPDAPPEPVVRQPRRAAYQPPKPPPVVEIKEAPPRTDWVALRDRLPKDATDNVDWVRALNEKLIEPRPGLDAKADDEPVLDLDVVLVPKGMEDFKVTYPHKLHTRLLACANCHTGIFQMQKGADPITMEKIFAGEYCGRCHGKVAFAVPTGCPRCHMEMPR
jgi:c(7)-type cytochrome triheme protein